MPKIDELEKEEDARWAKAFARLSVARDECDEAVLEELLELLSDWDY
jgi:hypothetical protein